MDGTRAQVTTLFGNDVLGRLERLRLNLSRRFTNKSRGENLSRRTGTSMEFSDYRNYVPGDDVRFVDWNVYARLRRPYLKLFREEEELCCMVLVEASSSMTFDGKLERAKQLAAAFSVMALLGGERVSVYAFNARREEGRGSSIVRLPACRGRASFAKLFAFMERIEGGGDAPLELGIETALRRHAGRGVAIVLSDFMTFGDVRAAMNRVFSSGMETLGVQILAPSEIEPELTGDSRLVDCETGRHLDVTAAGDLVALYQEYREAFERELALLCRQRGGRFASIGSRDEIEWVLFDLLFRKGWLR